ncbi:MAG: aspartate kinase [Bacteroidota bacterium]|nr:aspartate kinase [Bacteroidota bacterium]
MSYRVVKFGGSNLKTKNDTKRIVDIVKKYNQPLIIVVSAYYGITDNLIVFIKDSNKTKDDRNNFIHEIKDFYFNIIDDNILDKQISQKVKHEIKIRLRKFSNCLRKINRKANSYQSNYDEILSYGEKFTSLILTNVLSSNGIACKENLPEKFGLITDGKFSNASVNYSLSEISMNNKFSRNISYVVPGFYGISANKQITLLGRGGSDYSASAIAACVNAESLDVWKDVEGFLSADPRLVYNPKNIKQLSFAEASELAYFGSKILHPRTPEPLITNNIPIRIFNINNENNVLRPRTIINKNRVITKAVVKSVSSSNDIGFIKLRGPGVGEKSGILAKITALLDKEDVNIKSVITSQVTINILLDKSDTKFVKNALENLKLDGVTNINDFNNYSLIAVVGEGLSEKFGIAEKIFSAVAKKEINIEMISFGASKVAVYFLVERRHKIDALTQIHYEFFEKENQPVLV